MSAATASVSARGWILADFDDTLAPDDSHAGLLRFILRRRIWPLLLWPLMAFGAVIYLLPGQRSRGIALIWWAITLSSVVKGMVLPAWFMTVLHRRVPLAPGQARQLLMSIIPNRVMQAATIINLTMRGNRKR